MKLFIFLLLLLLFILKNDNLIFAFNDSLPLINDNSDNETWHRIEEKLKFLVKLSRQQLNSNSNNSSLISKEDQNENKIECPLVPRHLLGHRPLDKLPSNFTATSTNQLGDNRIELGGKWSPIDCKARHRVAIIIPYKNRQDQLDYFMFHMHRFLQRQELHYQIFVVEQMNDQLFNKGILMNAGYLEIMNARKYQKNKRFLKLMDKQFDCVVFHDVDLIPEVFFLHSFDI
jgi:hypothetical protein